MLILYLVLLVMLILGSCVKSCNNFLANLMAFFRYRRSPLLQLIKGYSIDKLMSKLDSFVAVKYKVSV